jgi:hypothetical protein
MCQNPRHAMGNLYTAENVTNRRAQKFVLQ